MLKTILCPNPNTPRPPWRTIISTNKPDRKVIWKITTKKQFRSPTVRALLKVLGSTWNLQPVAHASTNKIGSAEKKKKEVKITSQENEIFNTFRKSGSKWGLKELQALSLPLEFPSSGAFFAGPVPPLQEIITDHRVYAPFRDFLKELNKPEASQVSLPKGANPKNVLAIHNLVVTLQPVESSMTKDVAKLFHQLCLVLEQVNDERATAKVLTFLLRKGGFDEEFRLEDQCHLVIDILGAPFSLSAKADNAIFKEKEFFFHGTNNLFMPQLLAFQTEAKPIGFSPDRRDQGKGQIAAELLTAAFYNKDIVGLKASQYEVVVLQMVGVSVRILSGRFPAEYLDALKSGNLDRTSVRPTFDSFPSGSAWNLLNHEDRIQFFCALAKCSIYWKTHLNFKV